MRINRAVSLAAAIGVFAFFGAAASRADTLVVCTEASPDALNAQLSTANTSFDVSEQVADRLVEMKIGGSDLVPGLAESWTVSPDGLTYTFKLRHGVKWQSNAMFKPTRDFNADDVVFSFQRMMDKSNPFYQIANGNFPEFADLVAPSLQSVEKVDDYTVVFHLKTPLAPLLPSLSIQPFSIVSAEYAADLLKAGKPEMLDQQPIGTGPFSFVSYQKDAVIRFRAFSDFWGKTAQPDRVAKVDNLVFAITPDPSVRYAKLRTNECQIARYPNPADIPAMRANPDIKVQEADVVGTNYIRFRVDRKPLDDKRVRMALAMAIDMPDLVKDVFQGGGTEAASLVPPSLWGYDPSLKPYPYDPEGAKKLLAEAGYPNGFSIDLWAIPVVRAYMPNGRRAAEMIQSDWAKIGVKARIVTYEWGEYLKRARAGEPDVAELGATWDYPDPSEILLGSFACNSTGNAAHWCNKTYTDAVEKANVVSNQNERAQLYITADKAVYDDVPLVRLANVKAFVPVRKNVEGFKLHFLGGQPFGGVSLGK